jgi:ribosomal protein S20
LATKPRGWTGARTPSALKRVRTADRRETINTPRRSAAKTFVARALRIAANPDGADPAAALAEAMSALDRAAKTGAIHRNAAARRKSRLALKVNDALGGAPVQATAHVSKTTGRAAATKAAKARVAASKATKAKGAQTAAGKARAALSKTARAEAAGRSTATSSAEGSSKDARPSRSATKAASTRATAAKASRPAAKASQPKSEGRTRKKPEA